MRIHILAIACAFAAATASAAQPAGAQTSAPAAARTSAAALTVSTSERAQIARVVTADARVRSIVGANPRVIVGEPIFDKTEAAGEALPARHVPVVLFNPQTNRAASAISSANGEISNVASIAPVLVPFTAQDLNDALALVKKSAGNRIANLDRYRADTGGTAPSDAYVAQMLPVRGGDRSDPCFADRCADVIFRSPSGYLPLRAHTDLTKRTVSIEGVRK